MGLKRVCHRSVIEDVAFRGAFVVYWVLQTATTGALRALSFPAYGGKTQATRCARGR